MGCKGQVSCLATPGTYCSEHLSLGLPWLAIAAASRRDEAVHHFARAAQSAACRIVGIALLSEELLLAGAEGEIGSTVGALDGFVHKTHRITFFLEIAS